jgi:hypothetical protein
MGRGATPLGYLPPHGRQIVQSIRRPARFPDALPRLLVDQLAQWQVLLWRWQKALTAWTNCASYGPRQAKKGEPYDSMRLSEAEALERAMKKAERLDKETRQIGEEAVDLSQQKKELEQDEKVVEKVIDKLNSMDVEKNAPPRITQPNKDVILISDPARPKWIAAAPAVLAGLGILFLVLAVFQFRAHRAKDIVEHPPTPPIAGVTSGIAPSECAGVTLCESLSWTRCLCPPCPCAARPIGPPRRHP